MRARLRLAVPGRHGHQQQAVQPDLRGVRGAGEDPGLVASPDSKRRCGSTHRPTPVPGNTGEIDFAEFYSQYPDLDVPYLHYLLGAADPNVTAYNCTIDPTQFNTYEVDWTPSAITILYNSQVCLVDHPIGGPAPFNVAHFISLTQALGLGTNAPSANTPLPATTQIDWVRVWQSAD